MNYLLDSDSLLALVTTPAPLLRQKLLSLPAAPSLSTITVAELFLVAQRSGKPELLAGLERAIQHFDVLPFGLEEARAYATLSAAPGAITSGLQPHQLQVIAHAAAIDAVLVSPNASMRALTATAAADWTSSAT